MPVDVAELLKNVIKFAYTLYPAISSERNGGIIIFMIFTLK